MIGNLTDTHFHMNQTLAVRHGSLLGHTHNILKITPFEKSLIEKASVNQINFPEAKERTT
jgi:hypothetical protein